MVNRMPDEWVDRFAKIVRKTSNEYYRKYRTIVEREDVEQECWLWFASHVNKVHSWYSEHEDDPKAVERLVWRSLRNASHDYCHRQHLKQTGGRPEDVFWYDHALVKILLPGAMADDWGPVQELSPERFAAKDPAERGDWMAMAADIKRAFYSLGEEDQKLVWLVYVEDGGSSAANNGTSSNAVAMRAHRAVKKMVEFLGGTKPWFDPEIELEEVENVEEV